jgi:hypothetical protein
MNFGSLISLTKQWCESQVCIRPDGPEMVFKA